MWWGRWSWNLWLASILPNPRRTCLSPPPLSMVLALGSPVLPRLFPSGSAEETRSVPVQPLTPSSSCSGSARASSHVVQSTGFCVTWRPSLEMTCVKPCMLASCGSLIKWASMTYFWHRPIQRHRRVRWVAVPELVPSTLLQIDERSTSSSLSTPSAVFLEDDDMGEAPEMGDAPEHPQTFHEGVPVRYLEELLENAHYTPQPLSCCDHYDVEAACHLLVGRSSVEKFPYVCLNTTTQSPRLK